MNSKEQIDTLLIIKDYKKIMI